MKNKFTSALAYRLLGGAGITHDEVDEAISTYNKAADDAVYGCTDYNINAVVINGADYEDIFTAIEEAYTQGFNDCNNQNKEFNSWLNKFNSLFEKIS